MDQIHYDTALRLTKKGKTPGAKKVGSVYKVNVKTFAEKRGTTVDDIFAVLKTHSGKDKEVSK